MAEEKKQEKAFDPEETSRGEPGVETPVDLGEEPLVDLSDVGHAGRLSPDENPVALLEGEVASLKDQLLRAMAETENVRRRAQRDREDRLKYAAAPVVRDPLTVADTLQRALESVPGDQAAGKDRQRRGVGRRGAARVML